MRRPEIDYNQLIDLVGRSNATILDIGANNGDHSNIFATLFPFGHVFAFEPDPRALKKWRSQPRDPRIHMEQIALGREAGKATFYQSNGLPPDTAPEVIAEHYTEGWDASGSLRKPKDCLNQFPWIKFDTTLEVDVSTLDLWAAEKKIKLIDFIWADVQGAEADLIAGGTTMLRQTRYLYTEFSHTEMYDGALNAEQIATLLPDFEIVEIFQHDVLLRNTKFREPWFEHVAEQPKRRWFRN